MKKKYLIALFILLTSFSCSNHPDFSYEESISILDNRGYYLEEQSEILKRISINDWMFSLYTGVLPHNVDNLEPVLALSETIVNQKDETTFYYQPVSAIPITLGESDNQTVQIVPTYHKRLGESPYFVVWGYTTKDVQLVQITWSDNTITKTDSMMVHSHDHDHDFNMVLDVYELESKKFPISVELLDEDSNLIVQINELPITDFEKFVNEHFK